MVSYVDICNMALDEIGKKAINSLDESSDAARICRRNYEPVRDLVLASSTWHFARKRKTLAQLTATPDFEWLYQYQLPTDYIRMVEFNQDDEDIIPYEIEGDKLLTNETSASIVYIYRVIDTNLFDPSFVAAYADRLAQRIASPLTSNRAVKADANASFRQTVDDAGMTDSQEVPQAPIERSKWLTSRR